jgi:hypothetical protein
MRRPRASILPRRLAVAALLAAATALPAAVPAAAALPGHTGTRGVHVLIDTTEYPGVTCHYVTSAPGRLKRVAVRRPIVYAPDTTSRRDQRWVGWRYRIQRSADEATWETIHISPIRRAIAYDDQPAALQPSGKDLVGVYGYQYRAMVELWWYTPSGASTVTGRAKHPTKVALQVFGGSESVLHGGCPGSLDPATAATLPEARTTGPAAPPTHDGAYGTHTLVDSYEEYPGAICRQLANDDVKITVRAPAVFASSSVSGRQDVRWRYTIKGLAPTALAGPTPPPYSYTSPWTTSSATTDRAARWAPLRSRTIVKPRWPYYVVTVRIEWLGGGSPNPFAIHGPFHKNGSAVTGYCFGTPL